MKKKKTTMSLKRLADKHFSIWIRQRGMDEHGFNTCFTCGTVKPWKELQNGHYVSRTYLSLRYDPRNCNPQCAGCNIFKKGNLDVYAIKLIEKYGPSILSQLNKEKYVYEKWGRLRYLEIINEFKQF